MIGISDRDYAVIRFESFADEVLRPAVFARRAPLTVGVFQTPERISREAALRGSFVPVDLGFRWGPAWSTAWFRVRGAVPEEMAGSRVALRFSSGTEALLWWQGAARQGFDDNRDLCLLFAEARGGEAVDGLIEAACNMPLGISTFWWDHPEVRKRWEEEKPGRLEACELVSVDRDLQRFHRKYDFARRLALALPESDARTLEVISGLRAITNGIPAGEVATAALAAEPALDALLRGRGSEAATVCVATGHAHIDTAWLWPIAETRRKILRSWANALEVMEHHPEFRFLASQAWQYAACEEDAPELFERIRARVAEGRWEAGGAMWVECDANCPSGESLIRQILHGSRYWREKFGVRQQHLYLPDTFGFPASLPQIARLSGLDTFITDKIAWSERNAFPFATFRWRGIDGTELLSHLTPGANYNAPLQPQDLRRGEERLLAKDHDPVGPERLFLGRWLQPFGYGDGGGGPTEETVERAAMAADVEGLPRVEPARVSDFCDALHRERQDGREERGCDVPVWDGELYIEQHRGTFTSQARLKQGNAELESRLRCVEALLVLAPDSDLARGIAARLDAAWKTVLLHQFHDILPGTSIAEVNAEVTAENARVARELDQDAHQLAQALAAERGAGNLAEPILVFNGGSHARSASVTLEDGRVLRVRDLPPLGAVIVDAAAAAAPAPAVEVSERALRNEYLAVTLDDAGRIASLEAGESSGPVNARAAGGGLMPLNQLVAYEDRPRRWEAWNIDFDYTEKATPLEDRADAIEVLESGPQRGVIRVRRRFRDSTIIQDYVLESGSRYLEVQCRIDWQERRTLLRTLNPVGVRARHWTCGIQLGHLERATHRNTPWDAARFEVAGHRWMDVSQPGRGLALFDHARYGRSGHDAVLGLSLLRGPTHPDPDADRGEHRFRYGYLPHAGDWRVAGVAAEAEIFCEPPRVFPFQAPSRDTKAASAASTAITAFDLDVDPHRDVEVVALKPGEDGRSLILRLVERGGGCTPCRLRWCIPVRGVTAVDLLEDPMRREIEIEDAVTTRFTLRPFEILSLRAELGAR